jgi:hypothetical protein
MATTYTCIASNILSTTTATITFSSISTSYKDLVIKLVARSNEVGAFGTQIFVRFNGESGTAYSGRSMLGTATSKSSQSATNEAQIKFSYSAGSSVTANTFSNNEIYIPNYLSNLNKNISISYAQTSMSSSNYIRGEVAALARNTVKPINSITLGLLTGDSFVAGSEFYLYGIG